jgi:hypothetical protein
MVDVIDRTGRRLPQPGRTMNHSHSDRGNVTVWILALTFMIGMLGFLTLVIYVPFGERRELAGAADQAAQAGATALDEDVFRATGESQLDPDVARQRALDSIAQQNVDVIDAESSVVATTTEITVILVSEVDAGLIALFDDDSGPLTVRVTATGTPREDLP